MIKRGLWRTSSNILAPVVLSTVVLIATAAANGAQARSPIPPWCAWLLHPSAVHAAAWGNGRLCVPNSRASYGDLRPRQRWR
jgi:hypothetical protein